MLPGLNMNKPLDFKGEEAAGKDNSRALPTKGHTATTGGDKSDFRQLFGNGSGKNRPG